MRPVGTTSSCQSGPQGPGLRHRVSVSAPWVSSSRSSATSAVRGPGAAQAPGLAQARGFAHPRTPAHPGGAFPSLRPLSQATWPRSQGTGCTPPEAAWYQSLSSQVGAASCRTGERRAAVAVSLPRCVPTATYQPSQPRGQETGWEAQRAGDSVEPRPGLTEVGAQSVVRAQLRPLRRGPCTVSEPAVARGADVLPAAGVPLEVAGEGGTRAGRDPVVTWGGRGSGRAAARAVPLLPPAPAHRTAPRRGSPCSHTRSCTRPRGGSCSGWGPRPSRETLLPAETARWPGVGRPRCSSAQRPLRVRHPGTFRHRAKRLCREGARNPRRTAPGGPCQGPGGHVRPWRGWLSGWGAWVCEGPSITDAGPSLGRTGAQRNSGGSAAQAPQPAPSAGWTRIPTPARLSPGPRGLTQHPHCRPSRAHVPPSLQTQQPGPRKVLIQEPGVATHPGA